MTNKEFNEIKKSVYSVFRRWANSQGLTIFDFCEFVAETLEEKNYRKINELEKEFKVKLRDSKK